MGSQSPTSSNMPLRPLRPSIPATTFETQSSSSQPPYLFPAHHQTGQQQQQQQILIDASSSYEASNPGVFEIPPPVPGVAFVDGTLVTAAPSLGIPGVSCLGPGLDAGGHHRLQHHHPHQHHQHHPHAGQQPVGAPAPAPYMDVSGVLADYGLGPFAGATTSAPHHAHVDSFADPAGAGAAAVWPSPAVSSPAQASDDTARPDHGAVRKRRRTQSPARMSSAAAAALTASPPLHRLWASDSRLCRSTNGNMIGEMMMRIYHDVMEGALSCWLTEQTCPYNSLPATSQQSLGGGPQQNHHGHHHQQQQQQQTQFWGAFEDMQREWGPNWSNRIYRRVVKLDRTAHLLGLKRLSPADESRVSSALNAAVMAFTAQWAQGSQRSTARWPPAGDENGGDIFRPPDLDIGEEFDRTLQKSLWNQARKSLNDCSEIDSFRVVFAEIVFALTQKYGESSSSDMLGLDGGDTSQVVEEILREDTQQIWLERATRRLHVLRRRVELYERQLRGRDSSCYDAECRKTIDLLFWLAVMFDTISAAMTERPLTISDEDSANLALSHPSHHYDHNHNQNQDPDDASAAAAAAASSSSGGACCDENARRWNVILAKDQQTKLAPLRWPCTDQDIAQELTDAAPVKVLLYRKVTRLQSLASRERVGAAAVERAVADAIMVYAHWQAVYGALFADCIAHHVLLPARIQSWYVCLFGHWLLATLLLADLIDAADQRGLLLNSSGGGGGGGSSSGGRRRGSISRQQQAASIRHASVQHVSDLARASAPRHDDFGELENFHHAVSEGALLTEPWTMILIRTFSRAAIILLDDLKPADAPPPSVHLSGGQEERGNFERCEDCIKALWYLGRKSDMAREVARVLGVALQRARSDVGQ